MFKQEVLLANGKAYVIDNTNNHVKSIVYGRIRVQSQETEIKNPVLVFFGW